MAPQPVQHQQSRFLCLPSELRLCIYREYLLLDAEDGYVYEFEARKLRMPDMQPIKIDLMYTCCLVAREMRGMPLRLHTVTFRTVFSEDACAMAGVWASLLWQYHRNACYDVCNHWADVPGRMSDEMIAEVRRRYDGTKFYEVFCRIQDKTISERCYKGGANDQDTFSHGEVPSVFRETARGVLQLALTDETIFDFLTQEDELESEMANVLFSPFHMDSKDEARC